MRSSLIQQGAPDRGGSPVWPRKRKSRFATEPRAPVDEDVEVLRRPRRDLDEARPVLFATVLRSLPRVNPESRSPLAPAAGKAERQQRDDHTAAIGTVRKP